MLSLHEEVDQMKIALVDDNDEFRGTVAYLLREEWSDFVSEIRGFRSGTEAIDALNHLERFDVAIVDLFLGDISGFRVIEAFRNVLPKITIIVCTGLPCTEVIKQATSYGADHFVHKSIDTFKEIEDVLAKVFGKRSV